MPCLAQWKGHGRKSCWHQTLWAWGSERPAFTLCFHVMDLFTDFQPSSQRGKCDKDRLTNKHVMFLGLNKLPPFCSLRGWLWLFLPYKCYFSDWVHLPAETLLTPPLGGRLPPPPRVSSLTSACLARVFTVYRLPSLTPPGKLTTMEKPGQRERKLSADKSTCQSTYL